MSKHTLRVRARGDALVQDYQAMNNNHRRYIGRKMIAYTGMDHAGELREGAAFPPADEPTVEVPKMHEYVRHVQHGDLWAADKDTAEYCGVPFDPYFGEGAPTGSKSLPPPHALSDATKGS